MTEKEELKVEETEKVEHGVEESAEIVEAIEERIDELLSSDKELEVLTEKLEEIAEELPDTKEGNELEKKLDKLIDIFSSFRDMLDDHLSKAEKVIDQEDLTDKPVNEILDNPATTIVEAFSEKKKGKYAGHLWK